METSNVNSQFKKGKRILFVIGLMEVLLSGILLSLQVWLTSLKQKMMEQSLTAEYGVNITYDSGLNSEIFGAVIGIGVALLIAYKLYHGSKIAKGIKVFFAVIGCFSAMFLFLGGAAESSLLLIGLLTLAYNIAILYALLKSPSVKAVFEDSANLKAITE
jgi:hypothetical protein